MEAMSSISADEANEILGSHDLLSIGIRADEERRRRHGVRTTFVRVLEVHVDAIPSALGSSISAGEVRLVGRSSSAEAASDAVRRARALAGTMPMSAFSLSELWQLAGGSSDRLRDLFSELTTAGLERIAEAPIDVLIDPIEMLRVARDAGLSVPRLVVHQLAPERRVDVVELASRIQAEIGGVRAFAPLPRTSSIAQPSTGYDDVKQVAIARLLIDNIESIQVDWALYGPKLAQVALTMGADDVDSVSPFEGDLGRRRSPLEEIRGNILAAGLEPAERDGLFRVR
jgi:aminodeoxyfutalosine synthase